MEPMTVTKMIAVSLRPNHSSASGTQQMLGRLCKLRIHAAQRVLQKPAPGEQHAQQNTQHDGNGVSRATLRKLTAMPIKML